MEAGASHGESPPSRFVNFTSADGLPHDAIRSAFEDRNGSLWFCTGGGLTRYEGKQFHNFTLQEALLGGAAMSVGQNRDGQLFFGSWTGTSYYDGRHFATTDSLAATDHIWTFLEDSRGRLWFGGRRWDPVSYLEDGEFSTFAAPDGLMLWGVPAIAEDSQGRMWFGGTEEGEGNEGLRRYDGNELRIFTTADGLAHNEVTALLVDKAGILWIGTGGGLSRYDGEHFVSFTVTDGHIPGGQPIHRPHIQHRSRHLHRHPGRDIDRGEVVDIALSPSVSSGGSNPAGSKTIPPPVISPVKSRAPSLPSEPLSKRGSWAKAAADHSNRAAKVDLHEIRQCNSSGITQSPWKERMISSRHQAEAAK